MRHIRLAGHSCCQRRILIHEQNGKLFDFDFLAIIIRVRFKNHLLPLIPLLHKVTARANGVLPVILIISMLRHNSHNSHGIRPDGKRRIHVEFHRGIIQSHSFLQHGKIIDAAVLYTKVVGKSHIGGCQRLSVRKFHIVPYCYRPGKPILADRVIRGQIFPYF